VKLENTAICFAGGTGGHFVLQVFSNISYNTEIIINKDGSCHDRQHISNCVFVSDYYPLDDSLYSTNKEIEFLNSAALGPCDILVGHMRNLLLLQKKCRYVIYIEFNSNNKELLYQNVYHKTQTSGITQQAYDILKGDNWPKYSAHLFNQLPDYILKDIQELSYNHYKSWKWVMPETTEKLFKINYSDLSNVSWAINLAEFLNITLDKEKLVYLEQKFNEYKNAQSIIAKVKL
jgi:hypothetical protein